jgi:hypothetical protein
MVLYKLYSLQNQGWFLMGPFMAVDMMPTHNTVRYVEGGDVWVLVLAVYNGRRDWCANYSIIFRPIHYNKMSIYTQCAIHLTNALPIIRVCILSVIC